jgi:hypothetical protein
MCEFLFLKSFSAKAYKMLTPWAWYIKASTAVHKKLLALSASDRGCSLLCHRCVGVELSRSRHRNAMKAVKSVAYEMKGRSLPCNLVPPQVLPLEESAHEQRIFDCGGGVQLERGDILKADISSSTVVYVASLCFSQEFVAALAGAPSKLSRVFSPTRCLVKAP